MLTSIELINFMCHSHLKITFTKRVTCIGGRNGSGKSAIMIALGVAFGQRATALNRGSNLKELVKTGTNTATVKVQLKNTLTYRPDIFGDTICVEKTIGGQNKLVVKGANGSVWSRRQSDLDDIVDLYGLHFENPINFLGQDTAKKLLSATKSEALYDFFLSGTVLKVIEEYHAETQREVKRMDISMNSVTAELEKIESEIKCVESRIEHTKNAANYAALVESLENEKECAKIGEELKIIEKYKKSCEDLKKEMGVIDKEIEKLRESTDEIERRAEEEKRRNMEEDKMKIEEEKKREKLVLQKRGVENDLKSIDEQLRMKMELQEKVFESKKENEGSLNGKTENRENSLNTLKNELKSLNEKIEIKNKVIADLNEEFGRKQKEQKEINSRIEMLKNHEHQINQTKGNKLGFFHQRMTEILLEINKLGIDCVGPIGLQIKLKKHKWFKTLSMILKNDLSSFIVHSRQDRESLDRVFRKYNATFTILMVKKNDNLFDLKTNDRFVNVVDVIEAPPVVVNQLVVLHSIEQIILVDNRSDGLAAIRMRPKNVKSAFTREGDKLFYSNNTICDFRGKESKRYFFEDSQHGLEQIEQELKTLRAKIESIDTSNIRKEEAERYGMLRMEAKYKSDIQNLESQIRAEDDMKKKIDEIKKNSDLSVEIELLEAQQNALKESIVELECKIKDTKIVNGVVRDTNDDTKILYAQKTRIFTLETKKENLRTQIKISENFHKDAKLSYEAKKRNIANFVETTKSVNKINVEIAALNAKITMCKTAGDPENLAKESKQWEEKRDFKRKIILHSKNRIDELIASNALRIKKREEMKLKIAEEASIKFQELIAVRGYKGSLVFDHENKILDLKVVVDGEGGSRKTLSGGERSFAGISFLISLWPSVCCPVKVLDEFDVFMDNLNRKVTIRSLVNFLKETSYQVILITPLNTKDLMTDDCDIVVLEKPRDDANNED